MAPKKRRNLAAEASRSEASGVCSTLCCIPGPTLELYDCACEAISILMFKKQTGLTCSHSFQSPALAISDDGASRCLRLERCDAEVLNAWQNQGSTPRVVVTQHPKRLRSQKLDAFHGLSAQPRKLGSRHQ